MPLTLKLHPEARADIDPVLAERANGVVEVAAGAVVVLGRPKNIGPRSHLVISVGAGSEVRLAPRCFFNGLTIRAAGGGAVRIASDCTFNGVELVAFDGPTIHIGRDCMFSSEIRVMTTDHHVIRDAVTREQINPPEDVVIGEHVWIGRGVQVLKGARIGDGSVIGARALVSADIPAGCLAVGVPAKVVRSGIVWER